MYQLYLYCIAERCIALLIFLFSIWRATLLSLYIKIRINTSSKLLARFNHIYMRSCSSCNVIRFHEEYEKCSLLNCENISTGQRIAASPSVPFILATLLKLNCRTVWHRNVPRQILKINCVYWFKNISCQH